MIKPRPQNVRRKELESLIHCGLEEETTPPAQGLRGTLLETPAHHFIFDSQANQERRKGELKVKDK